MEYQVDMPAPGPINAVLRQPNLLRYGAQLNSQYVRRLREDRPSASAAALAFLSSHDEGQQQKILLGALVNAFLNRTTTPVLWDAAVIETTKAALASVHLQAHEVSGRVVYQHDPNFHIEKHYDRLRITNTWFQEYRYACARQSLDVPETMQQVPKSADHNRQVMIQVGDRQVPTDLWAKQEVQRVADAGEYNRRAVEIRRNAGGHLMAFVLHQCLSLGNIHKPDLEQIRNYDVLILHLARWRKDGLDCIVENVTRSAFHMRWEEPITLTLSNVPAHLPTLSEKTTLFKVRVATNYDTREHEHRFVIIAPVQDNQVVDIEGNHYAYQSLPEAPLEYLHGTIGLAVMTEGLEGLFMGGRYWAALKPAAEGLYHCLLMPRPLAQGKTPQELVEVPFILDEVAREDFEGNLPVEPHNASTLLDGMVDINSLLALWTRSKLKSPFFHALIAFLDNPKITAEWEKAYIEWVTYDLGRLDPPSEFCMGTDAAKTLYDPDQFSVLHPETWEVDTPKHEYETMEYYRRLMNGDDEWDWMQNL